MKFLIRQPFAIHLQKVATVARQDGTKVREVTTQSHFAGTKEEPGFVDLGEKDALEHLHKLEPADGDSKKFIADYHKKQDSAAAARVIDDQGPSVAEQVATAVIGALIEAGVIKSKGGAGA